MERRTALRSAALTAPFAKMIAKWLFNLKTEGQLGRTGLRTDFFPKLGNRNGRWIFAKVSERGNKKYKGVDCIAKMAPLPEYYKTEVEDG